MKLSTGPDMRYSVELTSSRITGSRRRVLEAALKAARNGIFVVAWEAPGLTELIRKQRRDLLDKEYREKAGI